VRFSKSQTKIKINFKNITTRKARLKRGRQVLKSYLCKDAKPEAGKVRK
jgi:hypothetical protein